MKKIGDMVQGFKPVAQQAEQPVNNAAVQVINKVFQELQAIYPAWKQAFPDEQTVNLAKKIWIKTFNEKNITTIEQIKLGMEKARGDTSDFIPSAGKFCSWCMVQVDPTESFYRFIKHEKPQSIAEKVTAGEVGYNCRRMAEDKALKMWAKHLQINIDKEAKGWFDAHDKPRIEKKAEKSGLEKLSDSFDPNKASFETKALMDRINRISK